MTKFQFNSVKYLGGSSLLVTAMAGSAHGQIVTTFPNTTVSGGDTLYFDVDQNPPVTSTTDTTLEFFLDSSPVPDFVVPKFGSQTSSGETTTALPDSGATVDSTTAFDAGFSKLSNGTNNYGFELTESGNTLPNYGYLNITQTEDMSGTFTETLNLIAINTTPGAAVLAPATPEPSTTSLLLAAATGVAGLALWRRRQMEAA